MAMKRRFGLLLLLVVLLLAGCATTPVFKIERTLDVKRPTGPVTLYVVPFLPILAPDEIANAVFDRFVDGFDTAAAGTGISASILKRDLTSIDKAWLDQQYYVTGELFAYREDGGCCSTELKLYGRLRLYQPGTAYPVVRIEIPYRTLFDHDQSNIDLDREKLIETLSTQLRSTLIDEIAPL